MNYPKTNIYTDFTDKLSVQHLCFLAKGIALKHFQDNGFYVTPKLVPGNPKGIFFPDFGYSKDFWKSINLNDNKNLCDKFSQAATNEAEKLLAKYSPSPDFKEKRDKVVKDWKKIEPQFWQDVEKYLDFKKEISKVEKIDLLITPFGSVGAFNPPRVGKKFDLLATTRIDTPAGNIAVIILQNLYIIKTNWGGEIGEEEFVKRMAVINFLFTSTIFSKYYPDYKDPAKIGYNIPQSVIKSSDKYLAKLGFSNKKIEVDPNNKVFTSQEGAVLAHLIEHKGNIVSFDKIAKILWGKDSYEKFSPQAIAKVIENIREKVRKLGINKEVVYTKRGKGYLFN